MLCFAGSSLSSAREEAISAVEVATESLASEIIARVAAANGD